MRRAGWLGGMLTGRWLSGQLRIGARPYLRAAGGCSQARLCCPVRCFQATELCMKGPLEDATLEREVLHL